MRSPPRGRRARRWLWAAWIATWHASSVDASSHIAAESADVPCSRGLPRARLARLAEPSRAQTPGQFGLRAPSSRDEEAASLGRDSRLAAIATRTNVGYVRTEGSERSKGRPFPWRSIGVGA